MRLSWANSSIGAKKGNIAEADQVLADPTTRFGLLRYLTGKR